MSARRSCRLVVLRVAVLSLLLTMVDWAVADEQAGEPTRPPAAQRSEPRGRLPNYYTRVVTPEQREKIYGIQQQYAMKIEALEKQLAELVAQRDAEVDKVLTPEQRTQVKALADEAAARARQRRQQADAPQPSPPASGQGGAKPAAP